MDDFDGRRMGQILVDTEQLPHGFEGRKERTGETGNVAYPIRAQCACAR